VGYDGNGGFSRPRGKFLRLKSWRDFFFILYIDEIVLIFVFDAVEPEGKAVLFLGGLCLIGFRRVHNNYFNIFLI
jgi:hypothetical protein